MTCTCEDVVLLGCNCSVCGSDCISVEGSGSTLNPLAFPPRRDPDEDNIWTCGPAGHLTILPVALRNPPSAQAFHSVAQSVPNENGIVVELDSERYDTDTMHVATVGLNTRLTFMTAGVFVVTFQGTFAGNAVGDRAVFIRENGEHFLGAVQRHTVKSASIETGMSVTIQEEFEAGEYVEALAKQDSGGALNLVATRYSPILSAHYRRGPTS